MKLTVRPAGPLAGRFRPPGDKSVTHRAYLFGLLARGETIVERPNRGEDCEGSLRLAASLGASVRRESDQVHLTGAAAKLIAPSETLDCGNSGTTLRLLSGVLAGQPFEATLDGDDSLRRRPLARVIQPLRRMGAVLRAADDDRRPPLTIHGGPLTGVEFEPVTASAQVATAILLAGSQAQGLTSVRVAAGARDHTERLLPCFGVPVVLEAEPDGTRRVSLRGPVALRGARVRVPGDASAASFFFAAAAATPGARVSAEGVGLNPTRSGLLEVLRAMGAQVEIEPSPESDAEPQGRVTVTGPARLTPFDVPKDWVPSLVDEIPAWVIAACAAGGVSRIRGAAELRVKESDRLSTLARNLRGLGIRVVEHGDGLDVTGGRVRGGDVEASGDHRIAMAFALLGASAESPVRIDDAASIATSFPEFVHTFRSLGGQLATPESPFETP